MDLRHYFNGYDPTDGRLRVEISVPARHIGAVQQALGVYAWQIGAHYVAPEHVTMVASIADIKLPKDAGRLDWFFDICARTEVEEKS